MWSIKVFLGMVGAFSAGQITYYFGWVKGMIIITVLMFRTAIFGAISSEANSPECLMISGAFNGLHNGSLGAWPVLFGFNAIPALACLLLFPLCPESPRYMLIKKNDEDGAKKALTKLRDYSDVEYELEEMRVEARKASSIQTFTLKKLLSTQELKLPIIIAFVVQVAKPWSGINAVVLALAVPARRSSTVTFVPEKKRKKHGKKMNNYRKFALRRSFPNL